MAIPANAHTLDNATESTESTAADEVELEVSELEPVEAADTERETQPRGSIPPPVPPELRRSSAPPPQADAHGGPGARSGTYPIPESRLSGTSSELEARAKIARLRLALKLRDDRVSELEGDLARLRSQVARLENAAASRPADDLKRIAGIGPAFARKLVARGVTSFGMIAAWDEQDVARVAEELGTQPIRVAPWIAQAARLSS